MFEQIKNFFRKNNRPRKQSYEEGVIEVQSLIKHRLTEDLKQYVCMLKKQFPEISVDEAMYRAERYFVSTQVIKVREILEYITEKDHKFHPDLDIDLKLRLINSITDNVVNEDWRPVIRSYIDEYFVA